MLKVRGFQVAPAELEGCILDHPDVTDTCVVGIPDDYSGELPLAFVVLRPTIAQRVKEDPRAADDVKASIMKVNTSNVGKSCLADIHLHSTSPIIKWPTRSSPVVLSLLMLSPRTQAENC
jgi:acyl-coenzyme A synthetase/AMP-(fatty) acid ligase